MQPPRMTFAHDGGLHRRLLLQICMTVEKMSRTTLMGILSNHVRGSNTSVSTDEMRDRVFDFYWNDHKHLTVEQLKAVVAEIEAPNVKQQSDRKHDDQHVLRTLPEKF